jgi:hypothetical protein
LYLLSGRAHAVASAVRFVTLAADQGRQYASLQGPHARLFDRLCVVPAADVERPVDREKQQFLNRCPADVAGLATPAFGGLGDRPFDRDDDVAQVGP